MCNGSRARRCWNSIGFSGELATSRIVAALFAELTELEGFDAQLRAFAEQAARDGGVDVAREWAELDRAEAEVARRETNVLDAIEECGSTPSIRGRLDEIQATKRELAARRHRLERLRGRTLQLPSSASELLAIFEEKFKGLSHDSPKSGNLLRLVVPEIHVYVVRLCDGGHLLPRARVRLNLCGIVPDACHAPTVETMLTRILTLDLFDPPQRERIREAAASLAAEGMQQRDIARSLPEKITQPAVTNALALERLRLKRHMESPYEIVARPPDDYPKLRRHLNPKYRFEPEADYQPPPI